jgi:2-dehydropantoate 2-reductase
MIPPKEPVIAIFGVGAIGGTLAGWLWPKVGTLYVVDLPNNVRLLREKGLVTYLSSAPDERDHNPVMAYASISEAPRPDFVLVCVKNYSLEGACKLIREQIGGSDVAVVGFQNGVENQTILPRYFPKSIFGVIAYNAWIDEPGVVGAQKRGPLVLGVREGGPEQELRTIAEILGRGVPTRVTDRIEDAAHSKMIVNLANSLTTLVGWGFREISDRGLFQRLLTGLAAEGVEIVRAAGYREVSMEGMPSWFFIRGAARMPPWLTRPVFNRNLSKMVMSSMAQDVLQRKSADSELETLNGHFIRLADKHRVAAPINRAVYSLCRERFGKPDFKPMDVREVWGAVRRT